MIIDSPIISGSYSASGSLNQFGNVVITGSLTITGGITGSISGSSVSASYAATASYWSGSINNVLSASFATSASNALTASYLSGYVSPFPFTGSAIISGSLIVTGSANIPNITGSLSGSLNGTASYAVTASNAVTASYLSGYVSPFPFTGSAIISGSLTVTGSVAVSNLSGSGIRYLVADASGSITAQSASAALKSTQAFTSTAGQTTFSVTNGYSTGYVDVFINGSKLSAAEFTDTSGTNIVLATGSFINDTVEVVKYTPALGVTNNVLRQLTTFTGSAGQTVFSASYTPGLLDIFYNGSRLSPSDYTANNGTFFTLATGSAANDILDVLVYSYQVGAFSGIGGQGVTNQLSFFNATSSISGSTNLTYNGSTLTLIGNKVITGSVFISGSKTIVGDNTITGSLTVSGSQTFIGTKTITGSVFISGSKTVIGNNTVTGSMSISGSLNVNGPITATTLVVQTITSSTVYSSGSNVFGNSLANTQTFTGSVNITGSINLSGSAQSTNYISQASSTISGLGPYDWSIMGRGTNGSAILINDIAGANYAISTGGYNLTFYKHVSGSNTFSNVMSINGSNATNATASITIANNLGIGTTTPYSKLQVNGNIHRAWTSAGSTGTPLSEEGFVYSEQSNSNALAGMWFENVFASSNGVAVIFKVRSNAAAVSEAMRISSDGEVLLGTSTAGYKLNVNGDINIPGTNRIVFNNEPNTWGISARVTTSTTNLGTSLKNIIYCGGGSNEGFAIVGPSVAFEVKNNGNVYVIGALSKGSGSFRIKHPLASKKNTHQLVHSFIEGPQADLIYRGKIRLNAGKATVNIDEASTMTEGTFEALCREVQCFTTNETGWDNVRGKVTGNILTIESQNTESTDEISWMVVGERQDEHMMDTDWTDDNGKVIVEPLIPGENN